MKKIAVVILNWNGQKLLEQFLPVLLRYSDAATVYVADNASTDSSVAYVQQHFSEVRIIRNAENYGFAKGYNEALRSVAEPYYALVNSDIEVTQNWLAPILSAFEQQPEIAILQPKILDYKNKLLFEYAGAAGGFIDRFGYPFCRGRLFDTIESDHGQYNDSHDIFWASGACFFIRKSAYEELKGFDADFFAHQEEIDLCWRAFNKGMRSRYIPESTVYHVGGATLEQSNPKKTYLNFRNSLIMLVKNLPASVLLPVILARLVLDGLAGVQFLLKAQPRHCLAVIRAHFAFYAVLRASYRKRDTVQLPRYYRVRSIVWDYYARGKRTFDSLF